MKPAPRTGIVCINEHTLELPEAEARTLFLAATALTRRSGPLTIDIDTTIVVNQSTQISLTIAGGFVKEYDPQAVIDRLTRRATLL
jgi:hypothetical protein